MLLRTRTAWLLALLLLPLSTAHADVLTTTDGLVLEGKVEKLDGGLTRVRARVVNAGVRTTSRGLLQAIVDVIEDAVRKRDKGAA